MSLLVTDGDQRSTLAVVRALGRSGIPVTVGADCHPSLAGSSRYCSASVRYPSPQSDPDGFKSFLAAEVLSKPYKVLLPMTDITVRLIAEMREASVTSVNVPIPAAEKIRLSQDKCAMAAKAQEAGIACPQTWIVNDLPQTRALAERLSYPVVIKPRYSRFYKDRRWWKGGVEFATGPGELISKCEKIHGRIPNPLIQERIEGEGRGVFLLIWDGELKAAFSHRRLREKPPWGGVSVYSESVPLDAELVQKSLRLLQSLDWQGVAMVEYKFDRRDGRPKFMEVNGRFWGSLQLAIDAGMNFPLLLYRLAAGESLPPTFDFKVGVRNRWLLGDLDHLLICLTHSRGPGGLPMSHGSRLGTLWHFLEFYKRDLHYEVMRLGDAGPGWYELRRYLREALRGAMSRTEE
jgi:predicted ATP-grasp superfamily ATP-dependent carboligase